MRRAERGVLGVVVRARGGRDWGAGRVTWKRVFGGGGSPNSDPAPGALPPACPQPPLSLALGTPGSPGRPLHNKFLTSDPNLPSFSSKTARTHTGTVHT